MLQSARVSSSSTDFLRTSLQAIFASWWAMLVERSKSSGATGYFLIWAAYPIFQLAMLGLVYRGVRPELVQYVVVGVAVNALIFNTLYFIGEILDGERRNGTLIGLFLAPCPRVCWLIGFALVGIGEVIMTAGIAIAFGRLAFGVTFHPNWPAVVLAAGLLVMALLGMGIVFSAIGLALKRSNDLSNLVSAFLALLSGVAYPVALLPLWLRIPARMLPIGYGVQALADASLHHAPITALGSQLIPLAGFAVGLPVLGALSFRWVERAVRIRGELDLY